MQIRSVFSTAVSERIEPVVKVADRRSGVVRGELDNLVVTPQWERYLRQILDAYVDAATRDDEQSIGIWISGFFGSGKSLLMKVLGVLLEGADLEGKPASELFLGRVPTTSHEKSGLDHLLRACERQVNTTAVGGNLYSQAADPNDPLVLRAFKLFAAYHGYTYNWPLAWAVEYQLDARGQTAAFRQRACELCCTDWDEVASDPEIYLEHLYRAAAEVSSDLFSGPAAVEQAVNAIVQGGVTPTALVNRLRRWCEARDGGGRRHKVLLQLDELGQWIAAGNPNDRTMQVQALAEDAAELGGGRVWLAVTAHGDVQALSQNVQQEYYAKILHRFALQCKLSNDDISEVVEKRVLHKTQTARAALEQRFEQRSGDLTDLGSVAQAQRNYPRPDATSLAQYYPYLPWTVAAIPDVVKGIAQAAGRDEALTGSNRTMIGVVQGTLIDTPGLLDSPVGKLVSLADLYGQLESDVPIETKTDLNRIRPDVPGADAFTLRVARGLFLLGQAQYIPTTVDNVARTVVNSMDTTLGQLRPQVEAELDRLVDAHYAKHVGEQYIFLSTQQRSFQDKVHARQEELLGQAYDLCQALKDYESEPSLRFDRVALHEREIPLRLELDGRIVRNPQAGVSVRVYSPLQRALDPDVADDTAMRQRSNQQPDDVLFRLADVPGFRGALALARATDAVANAVLSAHRSDGGEQDVAYQAKQSDLPDLKARVRTLLSTAVGGGTIFFRGSAYQLAAADSAGEAVRATLSQILPSIYPRLAEVPYRLTNEVTAVKAALGGNTANADLKGLGVYHADGTLNEGHPLLSTLRGKLPQPEQALAPVNAGDLRAELEKPPFGWDGNAVKVGLALLLRAAGCRLIDSGQVLTDPADPRVVELLTKEQAFKGMRVQGVRSELSMPELLQIRSAMETVLGVKPALVVATLNNVLGERLADLAGRAQTLRGWANTAQCPLPVEFESATSLVQDLLNNAAPSARLRGFLEQGDRLRAYAGQMEDLTAFRRDQGALFIQVRDFYMKMVNVTADLPALHTFVDDYRTVTRERTVTEPARWNDIVQAYHAARQAVTDQIARWQDEARGRLHDLEARLAEQVRAAGVPDDQVDQETGTLAALYQKIEEDARRADLALGAALSLLSALAGAEMEKERRLRELRLRYEVKPVAAERRLSWQTIAAGPLTVRTSAELDEGLARLRSKIAAELSDGVTVIIE
ncbi:MAG: BREX system P-loop protein BrxC [Anaerolineae bacterium]|nr:BREX system P-loop protein BrxC [Anaerolineae bacterium]